MEPLRGLTEFELHRINPLLFPPVNHYTRPSILSALVLKLEVIHLTGSLILIPQPY